MWRLDVADLMKANLESLKSLYKHFLRDLNPVTMKPLTELNLSQCLPIASYLDLTEAQI